MKKEKRKRRRGRSSKLFQSPKRLSEVRAADDTS